MRGHQILSFIFLWILYFCCGCFDIKEKRTTDESIPKIDTSKSIKIGEYWVMPKDSFDLNEFSIDQSDTLTLVTCSDFVYYPFGKAENQNALAKGVLSEFKSVSKKKSISSYLVKYNSLSLKSSRLVLYFDNDPEATINGYIFKGEVNDPEVRFINKTKIGLSKKDFISQFFNSFPADVLNKYNVIVFESCVTGSKQVYIFKDDVLKQILFSSYSQWDLDY